MIWFSQNIISNPLFASALARKKRESNTKPVNFHKLLLPHKKKICISFIREACVVCVCVRRSFARTAVCVVATVGCDLAFILDFPFWRVSLIRYGLCGVLFLSLSFSLLALAACHWRVRACVYATFRRGKLNIFAKFAWHMCEYTHKRCYDAPAICLYNLFWKQFFTDGIRIRSHPQ